MQREKLYNLQSKAYLNCILFFSKKAKLSATSFRRCEKSFFSTQTRNFFFLISSFYHLIRFIKKENISQDAVWKALQLTYDRFVFIVAFFCF